MPASARMASNRPGNFPSRSLIRNRARQPAAAPGGVHGGGQHSERVAERGAGRAQPGVRVESGELAGGVAAQRLSAGPQPPQPAPHGAGRHAEAGSDHPVPGALQCGSAAAAMTAMPCTRRGAHQPGSSTWVRPQARHRARTGLSLACVPPGRVITRWRACPHGPSRPRPHGQASRQPARAAATPAASAHSSTGDPHPGHRARLPAPGGPGRGAAGVAACRHDGSRQARTPRSSRSDTMNTAGAGKQPATSLAAPVFTVSPHTQGPYARQALISALTASVAGPCPGAQNEWRLTAPAC